MNWKRILYQKICKILWCGHGLEEAYKKP